MAHMGVFTQLQADSSGPMEAYLTGQGQQEMFQSQSNRCLGDPNQIVEMKMPKCPKTNIELPNVNCTCMPIKCTPTSDGQFTVGFKCQ